MSDTKTGGGRLPHALPADMAVHLAAIEKFCGENGVTAKEAAKLFDTSSGGRLDDELITIRANTGPGLWSKAVHDRYLGVNRRC